ncbi:hypothetical protein HDU97_004288 [Phlyctochytrium planicorne]|nr:hypothetical protein HDU97_004288 [Phlyctochytrium planicorne]
MASYFDEHGLDERKESRSGRSSQRDLNPDLDDFMAVPNQSNRSGVASSASTQPTRDDFLNYSRFLASVRERVRDEGSIHGLQGNTDLINSMISQLAQEADASSKPPAASKFFVKNLPKGPASSVGDHCAICVEPFTLQDYARITPCKHLFHHECITPWLNLHNTCPSCRSEFPTDDKEYERRRKEKLLGKFAHDEDEDHASMMYG